MLEVCVASWRSSVSHLGHAPGVGFAEAAQLRPGVGERLGSASCWPESVDLGVLRARGFWRFAASASAGRWPGLPSSWRATWLDCCTSCAVRAQPLLPVTPLALERLAQQFIRRCFVQRLLGSVMPPALPVLRRHEHQHYEVQQRQQSQAHKE